MAITQDKMNELKEMEQALIERGPTSRNNAYVKVYRPLYDEVYALLKEARQYTISDKRHVSTLVSVWGGGGVGKSGIVEELEDKLKADEIDHLKLALDSQTFSGAHNKAIKVLDEIVRELYKKNQDAFIDYVYLSEYFHNIWDKGSETIFKADDTVFEQIAKDSFKYYLGKILDELPSRYKVPFDVSKAIIGGVVKGHIEKIKQKYETKELEELFKIIRRDEEVAAKIVRDSFITCVKDCMNGRDPYVIILDNAESIEDEFSLSGQDILNDVYQHTNNIVWYFSGRDRFRLYSDLSVRGKGELLHVMYFDREIIGISPDEIIELSLLRGILVDNKMITYTMAKALGDSVEGNLRWINPKLEAMLKIQQNYDSLTTADFYEIVNASQNELLGRLIHTEFTQYRDEEQTFLLYGCIPQASNAFLNQVSQKMDIQLVRQGKRQWYRSEYEDSYLFSPAVATVLQKYIKEKLAEGDSFLIGFIDELHQVLLAVCEEDPSTANLRAAAEFFSMYCNSRDCVAFARNYCDIERDDFFPRVRAFMDPYLKNTARIEIYHLFTTLEYKKGINFFAREQQIAYLKKLLTSLLQQERIENKWPIIQEAVKTIKKKTESLHDTTATQFRTPRIENNIDLIDLCSAIRHRYEENADRNIRHILYLLQTEARCVSELIELDYDGCEQLVERYDEEYGRYSHEDDSAEGIILRDVIAYDEIMDYHSRFAVQCAPVDPGMLEKAEAIQKERIERIGSAFGMESLQLANTYRDCHAFYRSVGDEADADDMIEKALDIISARYIIYDKENAMQREEINQIKAILENLDDWMYDSNWRSSFHERIARKIMPILKDDQVHYIYKNILFRALLNSYEINSKYTEAARLINSIVDHEVPDDDECLTLHKYINNDPFFIEEIYRNFRYIEGNKGKEAFSRFHQIAACYLEWYEKNGGVSGVHEKRFAYVADLYHQLIGHYAYQSGLTDADPHTDVYQLVSSFWNVAKNMKGVNSWYGIERDLEKALFAFALEAALKNRKTSEGKAIYSLLNGMKQRRIANLKQEIPVDKDIYYNELRKLWYVDFILIACNSLRPFHGEEKEKLVEQFLRNISWKSYIPQTGGNRLTKTAFRDMNYDNIYPAFKMTMVDVPATLKKMSAKTAKLNKEQKHHFSTKAFVSGYLNIYGSYCREDLPYFLYRRYKAMLIEVFYRSRYYVGRQSTLFFKDAYIDFYRRNRQDDTFNNMFWQDYFDIYTDFMMLADNYEEAIGIMQDLEENDPHISFSINRRLSLLNLQKGDRQEALAKLMTCLDQLEILLEEERGNSDKYINYLYDIRLLFDDEQSIIRYFKEKKALIQEQHPSAYRILYAIDDILGMYRISPEKRN